MTRCKAGSDECGAVRLTHVESTPLAATMESTKTRGPQQGAALMKRTTKYVALEVHQATAVASVRGGERTGDCAERAADGSRRYHGVRPRDARGRAPHLRGRH